MEDHLQMFEFAGKLIAKAIYEGQIVNAQFAPFFIHQIKGFRNQNYSFLDDLATLDKDLYRNLQYIKVYRLTLFVFFNEVFCELKVCFTS